MVVRRKIPGGYQVLQDDDPPRPPLPVPDAIDEHARVLAAVAVVEEQHAAIFAAKVQALKSAVPGKNVEIETAVKE